jgi:aminopeptidase N
VVRAAADPYLPGHGDSNYEVIHYDLDLDYKVATNRLNGRATLTVRALVPLNSVRLDLSRLNVERVLVGGATPRKVTPKERGVVVKLAAPLPEGATTTIEVSYRGKPQPVPGAHGPAGWEELTDGVLVASQPYGAPSFFPCNDRADNKATYTITVTTEADYRVVATGRPLGSTTRAGRTRWSFDEPAPTSSYLVSVAIGRLDEDPLPGTGDRITVVRPRRLRLQRDTAFRQLPEMLDALESWFGPYPFQCFRAVVVDDPLEIPMEAQDMAVFGTNHLVPGWDNERLVVHELAHQWFGNAVTAGRLRDIWLHEGFARYVEWLWSERRGLATADQLAAQHRTILTGQEQPAPLSDPGMAHMFDDWVYKRGALMLHTLRRAIGEDSFFGLAREWIARYSGGTASTADFVALAAGYSRDDLQPLFSAWLDSRKLPKLPRVG